MPRAPHWVNPALAGPVGRILYNLYFDSKHVRSVTCDLINEYTTNILQENTDGARVHSEFVYIRSGEYVFSRKVYKI